MISKEEIFKKLSEIGLPKEDFEEIFSDVAQIALARLLAGHLSAVPEGDKARLRNLAPDQLAEYLGGIGGMRQISDVDLEKVHDETWKEYFDAITV